MKHFVLRYERKSRTLVDVEVFRTAPDAMKRRLELERNVPQGTEVIVLTGRNVADLMTTHGRYFAAAPKDQQDRIDQRVPV